MSERLWIIAAFAAAAVISLVTFAAQADENAALSGLTIRPADPTEQGMAH